MSEREIMPLVVVTELVSDYRAALLAERSMLFELSKARAAVESEKVRSIAEAYALGSIDLKNADTRKAGENAAVECSSALPFLQEYEREAEQNAEQAEIDRKCIEAEISLTKAWLYSQSAIGK